MFWTPREGSPRWRGRSSPGGAHVFTVPWYYWKPTLVRAVRQPDGTVRHLAEPDYHGNPIDAKGSLVVTEWGVDLADFVYHCSGLTTTAVHLHDRRQGIEGKFIEVFISRTPEIGPAQSRMQHSEDWVRLVDITPARKFRMLLHINPTRQRGKRTGSLAGAF